MFDLKEVIGRKSEKQPIGFELKPTVTVAIKRIFDEMVAESKLDDETNDADYFISEAITAMAMSWKAEKEKEAERQKREQERLAREAEEQAKRSTMPTAMPTERTRRSSQAA